MKKKSHWETLSGGLTEWPQLRDSEEEKKNNQFLNFFNRFKLCGWPSSKTCHRLQDRLTQLPVSLGSATHPCAPPSQLNTHCAALDAGELNKQLQDQCWQTAMLDSFLCLPWLCIYNWFRSSWGNRKALCKTDRLVAQTHKLCFLWKAI